jgi:hypothetical protein
MAESRQRRWQLKKKADGMCPQCGRRLCSGDEHYCKGCRGKHNMRYRKRLDYVKWHPGGRGRPPRNLTHSQRAKQAKLIVAQIDVLKKKLQALRKQEKRDG